MNYTGDRRQVLYWEGDLNNPNLSQVVNLRRKIKNFKEKEGINILNKYYIASTSTGTGTATNYPFGKYPRFAPLSRSSKNLTPEVRNVGLFSTAVCLETIATYWEELAEKKEDWLGRECNISKQYVEFVIKGLNGEFLPDHNDPHSGSVPHTLVCINALARLGNYLESWTKEGKPVSKTKKTDESLKEAVLKALDENTKKALYDVCINTITDFNNLLTGQKESVHPFSLYKFLLFVRRWEETINNAYTACQDETDNKSNEFKALVEKEISEGYSSNGNILFLKYFFKEKIYFLAKYELYRQMGLKLSGDGALYDPKRLIYSLMIVHEDSKFSNNLVKEKALELIFEFPTQDSHAIWPTGQLLPMSVDGLMSVPSIECAYDLLECDPLRPSLCKFLPALKAIYDCCARTVQVSDEREITGWYPLDQRDKTPRSWITALTLGFIKSFCKLLFFQLTKMAKEYFWINYRGKASIKWKDLSDASAAKSKLQLMYKKEGDKITLRKKTAILYGPPGTGKTTYGRALATNLNWEFIELTPGDFFSEDPSSIPRKINEIFEHLRHLAGC